jgi:hypothetical protein
MHEQGAQIDIAALTYPRCKFTAGFESVRVADRRDRGGRGEQADARDLDQSLALLGPAQGVGQSTFSFQGHGTRVGLLDSGPNRLCISCVGFIVLNK